MSDIKSILASRLACIQKFNFAFKEQMSEIKLKLVSDLTCSCCMKIFKDPFILPCNDSLCEEHLKEPDVLRHNKIKCKVCNQEFSVKDNDLIRENKLAKSLIEKEVYLDAEESSLKKSLKESIETFFILCEQFQQTKDSFELDFHNHFQEVRRKIDLQREELKEKIDKVALQMIEQTKIAEAKHKIEQKQKYDSVMFYKNKKASQDQEIKDLEEKFRQPNLSLQPLKQLQANQNDLISEIKSKQQEIVKIKANLNEDIQFIPNLTFDKKIFGNLILNGYEPGPFKTLSKILTETESLELMKLCEFSERDEWTLLYRGSRDGFGAKEFHSKCDGHSNTLTIIKGKNCIEPNAVYTTFGSGYSANYQHLNSDKITIFGGFASVAWDSSSKCRTDSNSFIFGFKNNTNGPFKKKVNFSYVDYALSMEKSYGPTFGYDSSGNFALYIADNSNQNNSNSFSFESPVYSNLNAPHIRRGLAQRTKTNFTVDEIEIYQKD